MEMNILKMGIEGSKNIINSFFTKSETATLLDPLTTYIKISLLKEKEMGTKLAFYEHRIIFNEPYFYQGTLRWSSGSKREDLHRLGYPTDKFLLWYPHDKKGHIRYILSSAVKGLDKLYQTYEKNEKLSSNLVVHAISNYKREIEEKVNNENMEERSDYPAIHENYKEFENLWLYEEIAYVVYTLKLIEKKKEKNLNYLGLIDTLEKFLDHKDNEFKEATFRLKNSI